MGRAEFHGRLMHAQHGLMSGYRHGLINIIRRLGLTSGLQLCLDAGDSDSYSGSGQQWSDLSGNANHYYRGANNTATTDDPTFNGTAGNLSASEYWSFDGGDYFKETAAQTFADGWAQNGALFTIIALVYPPAGGFSAENQIFSTNNAEASFYGDSSNKLAYAKNMPFGNLGESSNTFSASAWNFAAVSLSENGGASGSILRVGSTATTFNGDSNGSAATGANQIGNRNSAGFFQNTTRLSMLAAWNGVALTSAQLSSLYGAIKAFRHPTI